MLLIKTWPGGSGAVGYVKNSLFENFVAYDTTYGLVGFFNIQQVMGADSEHRILINIGSDVQRQIQELLNLAGLLSITGQAPLIMASNEALLLSEDLMWFR